MVMMCARCAAKGRACGECVVAAHRPGRVDAAPVDFTEAEQAAMRVLAGAGLIPRPRFAAPRAAATARAA
jgi:hypothetical protein